MFAFACCAVLVVLLMVAVVVVLDEVVGAEVALMRFRIENGE